MQCLNLSADKKPPLTVILKSMHIILPSTKPCNEITSEKVSSSSQVAG